MLFLPAGSLRFWQGWLFLMLQAGFWTYFTFDFLKRDPKLLERRMQRKESQPQQRWFQRLWMIIAIPAFILASLDFRFGWTRRWMGELPVAVVLLAQGIVIGGYWVVSWVMKANTFAASVIQVETSQTVIEAGPYSLVRHPMYTGIVLTMLATPLALGSLVTLPLFALCVPLLIFRLIFEERLLRQSLPGYADYCQRTHFRLIPGIW
jgi:protein-S-isoprenylcysteine O-methyltransferase Ste14